ncbi:M64 family metallopeptidase [Candidatus Woesearchaeota archaeon]|nr:M64 family metallopeptidase [Candidatus Woesearchaeota archaeon]
MTKNKKAQLNTALIMILSLIIVGGTIYFTYDKISNVEEKVSLIEYEKFIQNLDLEIKDFNDGRRKGSSEVIELKVPKGIKQICFVDRENKRDELLSPELENQFEVMFDNNLFIEPFDVPSNKIEKFHLDENNNPLCVETNKFLTIKLEKNTNYTEISSLQNLEEQEKDCIAILENGKDNIDLVFIGNDYVDNNELMADVNKYLETLKEKEPFKSNLEHFNAYIKTGNAGCETKGYIKCNNYELKKKVSDCPNDYIMVLSKRSKTKDALIPLRSSSVANIVKVNTADDELVLIHEFGHSFANLWDEYVDDAYLSQYIDDVEDLPNCDGIGCDEWYKVENTSCYKGCSLSNFYRAIENSIMNNYRKDSGKEFGPVNEKIILKNIELYK